MTLQHDYINEVICCPKLLNTNIELVDTKTTLRTLRSNTDVIGIYISGLWCTPCQKFTKLLTEFTNNKMIETEKQSMGIIFVSCDKTVDNFLSYFKSMNNDWFAIPYEERVTRRLPIDLFKLSGIPSLIVLESKTGRLLTTEGVSALKYDSKRYPWIDYKLPWYYSTTAFAIYKKIPLIIVMLFIAYFNFRGIKNRKIQENEASIFL